MWVEAGTPEENPRVQEGDHHNLTDTTIVDHVDQTRVATCIENELSTSLRWCVIASMYTLLLLENDHQKL